MSLLMALTALSIDAVLPALPQLGRELQVQNANDRQLVVSMIFLGLAMEPLGKVAGIGAAVVGALSTLISVLLGTVIGQAYNGTGQVAVTSTDSASSG